ncbi:MAG TPA: NAD(P)/FAD-dependent oxidoreductase, partial [Cyclobacteriaceae bacterium]|nr:NAD(P)/FAD-dependent oxidoreductase [Cyclobacteriaceae bacterium]
MRKTVTLQLSPAEAYDREILEKLVIDTLKFTGNRTEVFIRPVKRSIDARGKSVRVNVTVDIFVDEEPPPLLTQNISYKNVADQRAIIIVGAGPAGLFAALRAIELGFKPIILERGKEVRHRRRD